MRKEIQKETLEEIIKKSFSISEVIRKLGISEGGGSHVKVKKYIEKYGLDTSHFTGALWRKGRTGDENITQIPLDEILKENMCYRTTKLKQRLLNTGMKEEKCEICGISNTWNNKPLTMELHHINGNKFDNRLENLQILCPNCHSQTNNFRNKDGKKYKDTEKVTILKAKTKKQYICKECGKIFFDTRERKFCSRDCYLEHYKNRNSNSVTLRVCPVAKENIEEAMTKCNTITDLAIYFNVHRTTIREYLKIYDLYSLFKKKSC